MPQLTGYWFNRSDFQGWGHYYNHYIPSQHATTFIFNSAPSGSSLFFQRNPSELIFDLPALLNSDDHIATARRLAAPARITSNLMAGWIPWKNVPTDVRSAEPDRRRPYDLLIRFFFNYFLPGPRSYCTDGHGNISYYILPFLDTAGRPRAVVDGWSVHYDGGLWCHDWILDSIADSARQAAPDVGAMFDGQFSLLGTGWQAMYLLPGAGETSGAGSFNVDEHVSLVIF